MLALLSTRLTHHVEWLRHEGMDTGTIVDALGFIIAAEALARTIRAYRAGKVPLVDLRTAQDALLALFPEIT